MLFLSSQKPIKYILIYIIYIRKGLLLFNNTFSIIGECDLLFKTLTSFIIIDYITEIIKGIYNKKLSSKIGDKRIIKKFGYIFINSYSY